MDAISYVIGLQAGKKAAGGGGGSGGGGGDVSLNIAYGDTAPEDTTKLWVKTSEPSGVIVAKDLRYATAGGAFEELSVKLPFPLAYAGSAEVDGIIYIFGGYSGTSNKNTILKFDPTAGTIEALSAVTGYKDNGITAVAVDKAIYFFGGQSYASKVSKFNTTTQTVSTLKNYGGSYSYSGRENAHAASGSIIYAFGTAGHGNLGRYYTDKDTWDMDSAKYVPTPIGNPSGGSGFRAASVQTIGKYTYLFGGRNVYGTTYFSDYILKFDHETETYTKLDITLEKPLYRVASAILNGCIYLFGGQDEADAICDTVYCFDPATETLEQIFPNLPYALAGHQSAVSVGDQVYIIGGTPNCDKILKFNASVAVALNPNEVQILSTLETNNFPLIDTEAVKVEIGVRKVYKGNADGVGEPVEAALFKDGAWTTI